MDYAKRLKDLREDADYSQERVAKELNVGQKTYSDYELKRIRIPLEHVITLAKFYNVDLNYICGVSDIKNKFPQNK